MQVPASSRRRTPLACARMALFAPVAALVIAATPAPASAMAPVSFTPDSGSAARAPLVRRSEHVVIISVDGLRPDAIARFGATTLQRLMREGSYTLQARTILPSKTLPSHTSMLTGVDVDQHGITWNTDEVDEHGHVDVPTVFGLAKAQGLHTAAFFSKTKFHHLEAPNTIDYVRSPRGGLFDSQWLAPMTISHVERYLASGARPNLMFVHIGEPDFAGHLYGWMSGMYGKAVREADEAVARVLAGADARFGAGNYTVIVTSDHGGHGRSHGSADREDTTIPWITWGRSVAPGATLPGTVRTMDTAATALWLLGIQSPDRWVGRAVASAFSGGPAVVSLPAAAAGR